LTTTSSHQFRPVLVVPWLQPDRSCCYLGHQSPFPPSMASGWIHRPWIPLGSWRCHADDIASQFEHVHWHLLFSPALIREVLELLRLCAHHGAIFMLHVMTKKFFWFSYVARKGFFFPSVHGVSRLVRAESDSLRGSTWLHGLVGTRQEFTHARCFCGSAGAAFSGDVPMAVFQTWTV